MHSPHLWAYASAELFSCVFECVGMLHKLPLHLSVVCISMCYETMGKGNRIRGLWFKFIKPDSLNGRHTRAHKHWHTLTHIYTHALTNTGTLTHTHTHTHTQTLTHTLAHTRTNARTHTRTYARTHARTHAHTHTHSHTHTHTHRNWHESAPVLRKAEVCPLKPLSRLLCKPLPFMLACFVSGKAPATPNCSGGRARWVSGIISLKTGWERLPTATWESRNKSLLLRTQRWHVFQCSHHGMSNSALTMVEPSRSKISRNLCSLLGIGPCAFFHSKSSYKSGRPSRRLYTINYRFSITKHISRAQ